MSGVGTVQEMIALPILRCLRCGHRWIGRSARIPKTCSKCRSPYWDTERKPKEASNGQK